MSSHSNPPFFVAVIGAWIGLKFPKFTVLVGSILIIITLAPSAKEGLIPYFNYLKEKWSLTESSVLSYSYKVRIQIILALRKGGLSRVADWVFDSETKR